MSTSSNHHYTHGNDLSPTLVSSSLFKIAEVGNFGIASLLLVNNLSIAFLCRALRGVSMGLAWLLSSCPPVHQGVWNEYTLPHVLYGMWSVPDAALHAFTLITQRFCLLYSPLPAAFRRLRGEMKRAHMRWEEVRDARIPKKDWQKNLPQK